MAIRKPQPQRRNHDYNLHTTLQKEGCALSDILVPLQPFFLRGLLFQQVPISDADNCGLINGQIQWNDLDIKRGKTIAKEKQNLI